MTLPPQYGPTDRQALFEKIALSSQALDRQFLQFWMTNLFFGGFAALALLGYGAAVAHAPLVQVFCAAAGLFTTVCWAAAATAMRFEQSIWEGRVRLLEDYTVGPLYGVDEGMGRRHPFKTGMKFSVPALVMVFCLVLAAVFALLLLVALLRPMMFPGGWGFGRIATAGGILVFFGGASVAALFIARRAARAPAFGLGDNVRYLDIP